MKRKLRWLLAICVFALLPMKAQAQPLPGLAWCPMPYVSPVSNWYWFVPCGWAPTKHPWIYSVETTLPTAAAFSSVWFAVGNYNPYVPQLHVPLSAVASGGGQTHFVGCSEALASIVDWFSLGSFTSYVGVPSAVPTSAWPVSVGMGTCPG